MNDGDSDPDNFADKICASLKREYAESSDSGATADFMWARAAEAHWASGADTSAILTAEAAERGLAELVQSLYAETVSHLSGDLQQFCARSVRVRGVPSNSIEGAVYPSTMGPYAIVVTTGLMMLLNKIIKIDVARENPALVAHCNRCPTSELTLGLLDEFKRETIANFRCGESRGPIVFLHAHMNASTFLLLTCEERFIVCHELGHLVSDFILRGKLIEMLNDSFGTDLHRSEYLADVIGFAMLRQSDPLSSVLGARARAEVGQTANDHLCLSAVCQFFETLGLAYPGGSESHPAPHDRVTNIIATFYGAHFADHYVSWRSRQIPHLEWMRLLTEGARPADLAQISEALVSKNGLIRLLGGDLD